MFNQPRNESTYNLFLSVKCVSLFHIVIILASEKKLSKIENVSDLQKYKNRLLIYLFQNFSYLLLV